MIRKNILITGAHRSGSTWIGKIICESNKVRYVHEPFNINIKEYNAPFKHWFEYIYPEEDEQTKLDSLKYLDSFLTKSLSNYFKTLSQSRSLRSIYSSNRDYFNRIYQRTLFKDPIALLSAEWFYKDLNSDIVITIRHPAAFIASLKVKDWQFDFNNFSDQNSLIKDYLSGYQEQIECYAKNQPNIIMQGILLWNCLYHAVYQYKKTYENDWYFVKHEDLSRNPIEEFKKVFDFLNLEFESKIQKKILETTTSNAQTDSHRNAIDNIKLWKNRLSSSEIELIKKETNPLWKKFYTEEDW